MIHHSRLQELTVCTEDTVDVHDIELIQYINVDCAKLKRLLQGEQIFEIPTGILLQSYCNMCVQNIPENVFVSFVLTETVLKFKALKKPAQLAVINSLEKVCIIIINISGAINKLQSYKSITCAYLLSGTV